MALPIRDDDGKIKRWFGTSTDVHDSYLAIARRINNSIHGEDLLGRMGGDEFCVLLRNCTAENATKVSERIRQAIHGDVFVVAGTQQVEVTVSIGVTARIPNFNDLENLQLVADKALYKTKSSGRNRSVFLED